MFDYAWSFTFWVFLEKDNYHVIVLCLVFINRVAHLAGKLVRSLVDKQKDEDNKDDEKNKEEKYDKDELCVQIAGLCHDLGELFTVYYTVITSM